VRETAAGVPGNVNSIKGVNQKMSDKQANGIVAKTLMLSQEIQRSQSSVEISTNGKGEKSYKVKAYSDTIEEAIELAIRADREVAERLGL
jgi:predicted transcriptional regulator